MTSPRLIPTARTRIEVGRIAKEIGLDLIGDEKAWVDSVAADNRRVRSGDLFVALPGARVHGILFAQSAIAAGAQAILTDSAGATQFLAAENVNVPVLIAHDVRATVGRVAALVYANPARRMTTFGLTGTNGKTTTSFLLDYILASCGHRTGLIGTVVSRYADRVVPSTLTTPEAPELQEWLAAMTEAGVDSLTMEVSSHSIAMSRVTGLGFDVVGFTNLSQDHLDFHGDLESYFNTKAALFTPAHAARGVVMIDDVWGQRLAAQALIPVVTVATGPSDSQPDWTMSDVQRRPERTNFILQNRDGRSISTSIDLPGDFNLANAALALVMAVESGITTQQLADGLGPSGLAATVPGRMEVISSAPRVVVDFAHNAEALGLALEALRPTTAGRLIVVFGATGERDTGKRPIMGAVAAEQADIVIVSDDDPHGEDPADIRREVLAGVRSALGRKRSARTEVAVLEIAPRAEAIHQAILLAHPTDTVLLAGRGHEVVQEVAGVDLPLDDRVEARSALAARVV